MEIAVPNIKGLRNHRIPYRDPVKMLQVKGQRLTPILVYLESMLGSLTFRRKSSIILNPSLRPGTMRVTTQPHDTQERDCFSNKN